MSRLEILLDQTGKRTPADWLPNSACRSCHAEGRPPRAACQPQVPRV